MQLIRTLSHCPASAQGAVVALGNLDGLHLGHRAILDATLAQAKQLGAPAAVMTFHPHPREFFAPHAPKLRLMRMKEKIRLLREAGFSTIFMPYFGKELAATSAGDFVKRLLVDAMRVRGVVTGANFHFGARRSGDSAMLEAAARQHGFAYHAIAPVCLGEEVISSTAIRTYLMRGELGQAAQLLGRPYCISGHVAHGDKLGRQLGFPTLNIPMGHLFLPRKGVYAAKVMIAGKTYTGAASIGLRPTVGGTRPQLEIYLLDFAGDLYGQYVEAELTHFIRDEETFASLDILKETIARDVAQIRTLT